MLLLFAENVQNIRGQFKYWIECEKTKQKMRIL